MIIQVVGKQSFHSPKQEKDFYILHTLFKRDDVSGLAVEGKFVSDVLFKKAELNKQYSVVYDAYSNGRAFISDLVEVKAE